MSVKSQQVTKDATANRVQSAPALISRVRGFAGNHTMRTRAGSGWIPIKSHATTRIQPKLTVNTPGNLYEQEADRVAERVTRMPEQSLQRPCACGGGCPGCKHEEQRVQRRPLASTITPFIQAKRDADGVASDAISNRIVATRGSGSALPEGPRKFMESRFGADFSGVRVHTDAKAVQLSRELCAQAFTVGNHVYFNSGKFAPASSDGKRLLAHELTHTVQQGASDTQLPQSLQRQPVTEAEEEDKDESVGEELPDTHDDAMDSEEDISKDCVEHTKPKPSASEVDNPRKGLSWGHRMRKHPLVNKHFSGGGLIGLLGGTRGKYRRHWTLGGKRSPKSKKNTPHLEETKEVSKEFKTLTASDSYSIPPAHLDTSPDVFGGSETPGDWARHTTKKTHHDSDLEGVYLLQPDPTISMPPCSKLLSYSTKVNASGTFSYRLGGYDYPKKTSSISIVRSDDGGISWSVIWKVENTTTLGELRTITLPNLKPGKYDIITTYDDWLAGHTRIAYDFKATIQSVKTANIVITKIKYVSK